jgi:hypothetical protein
MLTLYEKLILSFNFVFLILAMANLTIGIWNLMANRRVADHANELSQKIDKRC